jgi:imidazolonepropionase-like amidohydrolase
VSGRPPGVTAFVNVAVVPMDRERVLPGQTVLVQNGWITALDPGTTVKVPAGAVRIDSRGKYLLPGPADMHAHLTQTKTLPSGAVGKRADLVLVNGNPLTDIRHTREPAGVMLGGRWLARTEIDQRVGEFKDIEKI